MFLLNEELLHMRYGREISFNASKDISFRLPSSTVLQCSDMVGVRWNIWPVKIE